MPDTAPPDAPPDAPRDALPPRPDGTAGTTAERPDGPVDTGDDARLQGWLDHFGVTAEQLREAVAAVGRDPDAVAEHLLHQGGSAGAG